VADFWRVKPGQWPLRNAEVRVQLRRKTFVGSVLLDEFRPWVDDVAPAIAVQRAKNVIMERRAHEDSVRAVLGDSPVKEVKP
jgi:hypothetical protein